MKLKAGDFLQLPMASLLTPSTTSTSPRLAALRRNQRLRELEAHSSSGDSQDHHSPQSTDHAHNTHSPTSTKEV